MFNNAQNTVIAGGSFNITNLNADNPTSPGLNVLRNRVAPNAILNAGGRADEVRCHPGTREEVISRIEKWGDAQDGQMSPMFWLSGPAGAGKSAIVQTVAERCKERGVPHADFFFFRGDTTRSHASPLIATLLHQIVLLYPSLQDHVATTLSTNPLLFESTLDNQLEQLIATPLRYISQRSPTYHPLILLIDGLDECNSDSNTRHTQQQILRAFDKLLSLLAQHPGIRCPFRLLVASRDESQIRATFNKIASKCLQLYLDDQYSPENDILVFVIAQFEEVKKTHPLAHTLDPAWPSVEDVKFIVNKSSGQFIFAATVMRFILGSSASPMLSLERVQGAAQLATRSPFSHLDAIYTYILSQVDDQGVLRDILNAEISSRNARADFGDLAGSAHAYSAAPPIMDFLKLLKQTNTSAAIISCLADLTPLAQYKSDSGQLLFYHASFPDYLLDQSRSGDYFVDTAVFNYEILPIVWKFIENGWHDNSWVLFGVCAIIRLHKLPQGVISGLASSIQGFWPAIEQPLFPIFVKIHNMCISDDDIITFRRILRCWLKSQNLYYYNFESIKTIPFAGRYFRMAHAEQCAAPDEKSYAALRPETDFDRRELALWLNDLLHHIHRETYSHNLPHYRSLLRAWISWSVSNDIPLNIPHYRSDKSNLWNGHQPLDIPYGRWYCAMARADCHQPPDSKIFAVLRPESDIDRQELSAWLDALLDQIQREIGTCDSGRCKHLLKAWKSWAVAWDDISGASSNNLPDGVSRRYTLRNMAQKWTRKFVGRN